MIHVYVSVYFVKLSHDHGNEIHLEKLRALFEKEKKMRWKRRQRWWWFYNGKRCFIRKKKATARYSIFDAYFSFGLWHTRRRRTLMNIVIDLIHSTFDKRVRILLKAIFMFRCHRASRDEARDHVLRNEQRTRKSTNKKHIHDIYIAVSLVNCSFTFTFHRISK